MLDGKRLIPPSCVYEGPPPMGDGCEREPGGQVQVLAPETHRGGLSGRKCGDAMAKLLQIVRKLAAASLRVLEGTFGG